MIRLALIVAWSVFLGVAIPTQAEPYNEPPLLAPLVESGAIPPMAERLPESPSVVSLNGPGQSLGRYGGTLRTLMSHAKDIRMVTVYGYARLVAYNRDMEIVPDILEAIEVKEERIYTLHLRKGHRWSDGHPFTSEDFRYFWEDMALNEQLSPTGPPIEMLVDGERPKVEFLDETTIRYTWSRPNPQFLALLSGARPLYIYAPAHYLRQFHSRYAALEELERLIGEDRQRNWAALHTRKAHLYDNSNPDLPTLQPWIIKTPPPSERFVFVRNPFYHRVDTEGRQLPYIDRIAVVIANAKLIPAKAGSGETDLQGRYLSFNNYTFLKSGEKRNPIRVFLWPSARGSHFALFPNLNANDPVWRDLLREADFRRALSLAIDRHEINQVIFFGLAKEATNTVLPKSPLYRKEYARAWSTFDLDKANALLDGLGLTGRDDDGFRKFPDGRTLEIVVETTGETTEQSDILELISDNWRKIGIKLFAKALQRDVFRNRVFAGYTVMSVWSGLENGVPTENSSPHEFAPTSQLQLQWPKWGQYVQTGGMAGEPVDMELPRVLDRLNEAWNYASQVGERRTLWRKILEINADQCYSIGVVSGVQQPIVTHRALRNIPEDAVYNWDPGAHFGIYRPDTFWFDDPEKRGE